MAWGDLSASYWVIIIVAVLIIALYLHLRFWASYYQKRVIRGEQHSLLSTDGWRITLEYLPAKTKGRKGSILCCPGLACNGRIFHLTTEWSFAEHLTHQGYDVWILHPRGTGPSERANIKADWQYGYADYVKDGIATAEYLFERQKEKIFWVGHSMGGLIGYEISTRASHAIQGLVTLGTPTNLALHNISRFHFTLFKWFCRGLSISYLGKLSTLIAPWAGWVPALTPKPLYVNHDLLPPKDLRFFLAVALEDTPRQLITEFLQAIQGEGPLSEPDWIRYRWMLARLPVPLLAIVGTADGLAPLAVTSIIQKWGPRKRLTYKEVEGAAHAELAIGKAAVDEVLPHIYEWLNQLHHSVNHVKTKEA
jgi:pimeloyl-ACP methyl ester carboxylesterase